MKKSAERTRAEAIERARYKRLDTEALEYLYEAGLIAGLQRAVEVIDDRMERATYAMFADDAIASIRAEITRLKKEKR